MTNLRRRLDRHPGMFLVPTRFSGNIAAIGVVLIGVNAVEPLLVVLFLVAAGVLWLWGLRLPESPARAVDFRFLAAVNFVLMSGVIGVPIAGYPDYVAFLRPALVALGGLSALALFFWGSRPSGRLVAVAASLTAGLALILTLTFQESALFSDVFQIHTAAGQALLAGQNPYTDAVQVVSGNPHHPPGTIVEGYPYTPVVLFTYGLVGGIGDPRLVSTLALLGIMVWLGRGALTQGPRQAASLAALVLIAFTPLLSEVWFMAWTEPLTLILFLGAVLAWRKSWLWCGILLGLALVSKQYLVFLTPLLLLHRDEGWRRRSLTAVFTAGVTLLAGLIPNPTAFITATFGNLVDIGFRPDTQSLPGAAHALGWEFLLPTTVWLLVSFGAGILVAQGSTQPSQFIGKSAMIMTVPFLLGMAFPNYWFLVACLLAVAMVISAGEGQDEGMLALAP